MAKYPVTLVRCQVSDGCLGYWSLGYCGRLLCGVGYCGNEKSISFTVTSYSKLSLIFQSLYEFVDYAVRIDQGNNANQHLVHYAGFGLGDKISLPVFPGQRLDEIRSYH